MMISMTDNQIGMSYALMAAVTWACALILFRLSGKQIEPLPMNLFKNAVASVLLVLTVLFTTDGFDRLSDFPIEDHYILILSGFLGLTVADTLFFYSLNLVGVSLFVIVDCTYSPLVLLVSVVMLSEELSIAHYLGGGLILTGLFLTSRHPLPANRTRRQIVIGILCGVGSMAFMAVGIVMAKPVMTTDGYPLVLATTVRLIAGFSALALVALASPRRRHYFSVFKPAAIWKHSLPATFLGSYLAMIFWVGGFKYTSASLAAVLNQTSVVFAIILATIFLKEAMTVRKLVAVVLALSGVVLVTVAPW